MSNGNALASPKGVKTAFVSVLAALALSLSMAMPQAAWAAQTVSTADDFVNAVAAGGDIVLAGDIHLDSEVTITKDVNIDLGGFTLTAKSGSWGLKIDGASVSIDNGAIEGDSHLIRIENGANVNLGSNANLSSTGGICAFIIKNSTLTTSAELSTTSSYAAIQGNGNPGNGGVTVNVTGGIVSAKDVAVYFPNTTNLNISGGILSGYSAVYVKSGNLNITGGNFYGNGDPVPYAYNPSGCNATGDAVIVEACDYPGGVPTVSISGGSFESYGGLNVGYYQQNDSYSLANEKFITGGSFNNMLVGKLVADDKAVMMDDMELVVVDKSKALPECDWCVAIEGTTVYATSFEDVEFFEDAVLYGVTFNYVTADGTETFAKVYVPLGSVVEEGDVPTVPERSGFEFSGWDKDTSAAITAPTVFNATYKEVAGIGGGEGGESGEESGNDKDAENDGKESVTMKDNGTTIAQTGDGTIVVALALIVVLAGAVLGGSYYVTRRNAA